MSGSFELEPLPQVVPDPSALASMGVSEQVLPIEERPSSKRFMVSDPVRLVLPFVCEGDEGEALKCSGEDLSTSELLSE